VSHFAAGVALLVIAGCLAADCTASVALAAGGVWLVLAGVVFDGVGDV
jgi:hypothetical protein